MKKILEINIREDGITLAGCEVENDLDGQRLGAAFIVLAHESRYFAAALLAATNALLKNPKESKEFSEVSKAIASAKIFNMTPKPGSKS